MDINKWSNYCSVFEKVIYSFLPYTGEDDGTGWIQETELYYKHYLFYVFLFMAVKTGMIPYQGNLQGLALLKGEKSNPHFCIGYDEAFLNLAIGIMKGCGFELPVLEHVRYPAYINGRNAYHENRDKLREVLQSAIDKLPLEVSLCWQEESETNADICSQAGYYMDSGLVIAVYTHRRYHKIINTMKRNNAAAKDIEKLITAFQRCQEWFYFGIGFTKVEVDGVIYCGEVMPVTISTANFGDIESGFSTFFNEMLIYDAVTLMLLIEKMERNYI